MSKEAPGFQRAAAEFVIANDLEVPIEARLLDLVSEVGELSKEALKGSLYGSRPFQAAEGWPEELGDVFFALVCVANSTGVDLEAALTVVIEKYARRLASTGDCGSA